MDRRLIGALLVVAVAATAAVLPVLDGRRVAGVGQTIALPPDPRVGDCVFRPPADALQAMGELIPTPSSEDQSRSVTTGTPVDIGSCPAGQVFGEVVAVVTTARSSPTSPMLVPPLDIDCRSAALEYAGLVRADQRYELRDQPADDPVRWDLSIDTGGRWVLPASWLAGAGRTWTACVAAPDTGAEYAGRLADAYAGQSLPAGFGTCWDAQRVSAAARMLDCSRRHLAELISAGHIDDISTVTSEQVNGSCQRLAALVMRRADPTGGGVLVIRTSPERINNINPAVRSVNLLCYVSTAERELDDTLVGLGERPIPFAD